MQYPRHLLSIDSLNQAQILHLFKQANALKKQTDPILNTKIIALLFFEPSTRTINSFTLAAKRLGATVLTPAYEQSAVQKGESLVDNALTLAAMGVDCIVIRHPDKGAAAMLAKALADWPVTIINAGDGVHEHPTQALLDLYTMAQYHDHWETLRVTILGDILHSRVANSLIKGLITLGVNKIHVAGPKKLMDNTFDKNNVFIENSVAEAVKDADVIVTLRLQKERMSHALIPNEEAYFAEYGLTQDLLKTAKPNALVMHPGPINRNIEIAAEVADGKQSVILEQVTNGVLIRTALFATLLQEPST